MHNLNVLSSLEGEARFDLRHPGGQPIFRTFGSEVCLDTRKALVQTFRHLKI